MWKEEILSVKIFIWGAFFPTIPNSNMFSKFGVIVLKHFKDITPGKLKKIRTNRKYKRYTN